MTMFDPPAAEPAGPMSTEGAARSAIERMLARRATVKGAAPVLHAPELTGQPMPDAKYIHLGGWGEPKTRKTSFGVRARSSEIRLKGEGDMMTGYTPGPVVMESRPLSIVLANFDRPQETVLDDLPPDSQVLEERFYCREDGEFYVPALMSNEDWKQLYDRYVSFCRDAVSVGVDLIVTDGGTIMWEQIRSWQFGSTEAEQEAAPKDYAGANTVMRERVMQRSYALPVNTYITREAAEVWASASKAEVDQATGETKMKPDGWKHIGHYIDLDLYFRISKRRDPKTAEMVDTFLARGVGVSIKAALLGREWVDPTFSDVFTAALDKPLIRNQDREEWEQLKAEHGDNLEW